MNIDKELEQLIEECDMLDEYDCVKRLNMGQLRHICRYFYNLGKIESRSQCDSGRGQYDSDYCPCCGGTLDSDGCCSECGYGRR